MTTKTPKSLSNGFIYFAVELLNFKSPQKFARDILLWFVGVLSLSFLGRFCFLYWSFGSGRTVDVLYETNTYNVVSEHQQHCLLSSFITNIKFSMYFLSSLWWMRGGAGVLPGSVSDAVAIIINHYHRGHTHHSSSSTIKLFLFKMDFTVNHQSR